MIKARLAAAALALCVPLWACGGDKEPLTLGVAGPIAKANGRSLKLAAEMAVEEINKAGGVGGRNLQLVIEDDNGDAGTAIEVAARLRANPAVLAVIGHVNSGATLAAAPIYNESGGGGEARAGADSSKAVRADIHGTDPLVEISPASSQAEITTAGDYTFRTVPSDLDHGPVLARQAAEKLGRQRAAILFSNDDYGRGVMASFADAFRKQGRQVVESDPYLPGSVDNSNGLEPYLSRAMRNGADALVIAGAADRATGGTKAPISSV
jgi:branched-chain amino acid transport system substrate-binding protein